MVCFKYIVVNTLHKGDNKDYYYYYYYYYANSNNNNNNNKALTEERTVSESLWQPHSPDLSTCGFLPVGILEVAKLTNQILTN
jgi:hypothetical protein